MPAAGLAWAERSCEKRSSNLALTSGSLPVECEDSQPHSVGEAGRQAPPIPSKVGTLGGAQRESRVGARDAFSYLAHLRPMGRHPKSDRPLSRRTDIPSCHTGLDAGVPAKINLRASSYSQSLSDWGDVPRPSGGQSLSDSDERIAEPSTTGNAGCRGVGRRTATSHSS